MTQRSTQSKRSFRRFETRSIKRFGLIVVALSLYDLRPDNARANSNQIPINVSAQLARGCPSASEFALSLIRRTRRLRLAAPGETGIAFYLVTATTPQGYLGQLQIRELDGRITQRTVEASSCGEIVNAFAFVAAVLMDPEAAAAIDMPKAPQPPIETKSKLAESESTQAPPRQREPAVSVAVGVTFGTNTVAAPSIAPNFGPRLSATSDRLVFPFWVTLGWDYRIAAIKTVTLSSTTIGEAPIGGWTTYLLASPVDWHIMAQWHLRPSFQFELGRISVGKVSPDNGQGHDRTWLAVGVGANLEARLAAPLSVFFEAGLIYPLHQPSFYFVGAAGPVSVYSADSLGYNARTGLALHFW